MRPRALSGQVNDMRSLEGKGDVQNQSNQIKVRIYFKSAIISAIKTLPCVKDTSSPGDQESTSCTPLKLDPLPKINFQTHDYFLQALPGCDEFSR